MTEMEHLTQTFRQASLIGDALGILGWDMATLMPEGGANARAEQMALLRRMAHEMVTRPEIAQWLDQAQPANQWQAANLVEMRRHHIHASALPADLVEALTLAESKTEMLWREARPKADFKLVLPALRELLNLTRQAAMLKAEALGVSAYDALLDQFEPDGRSAEIDVIFADLESFLPGFIQQALEQQAKRPAPKMPKGPFDPAIQEKLARQIMTAMGFDFDQGRLDTSLHPFCGGYAEDTRITTRYDQNDFLSSLMGVIHETGHALYDKGLPKGEYRHQPVGQARGMQLHESQSLLMEMQACRSQEFLSYLAPLAAHAFGASGPEWDGQNLYRIATRVKPDFIRVDADEVTYPAHVIIRYQLEKALIDQSIDLADLPEAWNAGYERLLGIRPPDDRLGVLQDIHWYTGSFGYFPTYTLGAMSAAQIYQAALVAMPDIPECLSRGDFQPLLDWLRPHIHGLGSVKSTRDILIHATGKPLDATAFKGHLARRYLSS